MYCKKLQNIYKNKDSAKSLIDTRVIYKLDDYLKNHLTLRERQNINPANFSIEMNISYKTALMTFIIGARVGLFRIRSFYKCGECGEQQELNTLNKISCECGKEGNYQDLKEQITLYFFLLEKPQPCNTDEDFKDPLDLLEDTDIKNINEFSFADVEKVGGSIVLDEIESSICKRREAKMKKFLGE